MTKSESPQMDPRCPLGLKDFPRTPCPLALDRLKWLQAHQGNISHIAEQERTGDCPYAIRDSQSNYCFFAYMDKNGDVEHSAVQVAELCQLTQAAVAGALDRAQKFLKKTELLDQIRGDE